MKIVFLLLFLFTALTTRAQTAQRYDILITELLPDPAPPVGLPNAEFIELFNRSRTAISLQQWKISDGSSTAVINSPILLPPDSFLIVCASTNAALFRSYGTVITVSNFPSLNNDADRITLSDASGRLIHAIEYEQNWYRNPVKEAGGWSLEMIDTNNPCNGASNWKASTDPNGGSPGKFNSVGGSNPDNDPPIAIHSYFIDSITCVLQFNESLDSIAASRIDHYTLDITDRKPLSALPVGPLFKEVWLQWAEPIERNKRYMLRCNGISDCSGNRIATGTEIATGRAIPMSADDMVINEILFNPPPEGADYIEILNRSASILDLKELSIAGRNSQGQLQSVQSATAESRLLFPGDHILLSTQLNWLPIRFSGMPSDRWLQLPSFPSMPDDRGIILLLNTSGAIIDELHYEEKWHHPLLDDKESVALERIDPNAPTQLASNWTSAASTYNYGTPGHLNSQRLTTAVSSGGSIQITPAIISPNQDGIDDRARIHYKFDLADQLATVRIFDSRGRLVRLLKTPHTISAEGYWLWDGLNDSGQKVATGSYIVLTEVIHLSGKVRKYRNVVGVRS